MTETNPKLEEMRSFYDDVYYADANKSLRATVHLRRIVKIAGVSADDAVLDIACGLGEWLRVCMNAGSSIAGVDLSERAIEYCKKHMPEGEFHAVAAARRSAVWWNWSEGCLRWWAQPERASCWTGGRVVGCGH